MIVTTDLGENWELRGGLSGATDGKMFTPTRGLRILTSGNTSEARWTNDGGWFYFERGATWTPAAYRVFFEDSTKFWRLNRNVVYRSWDKGETWSPQLPLDTTSRDIVYWSFHRTADTNRFYIIGGDRDKEQVLMTTNGGANWKALPSTPPGRVFWMAEETKDKIWLLVSRELNQPNPNRYIASGLKNFADTLYFTTDGGSTWSNDLTFVGDTISELQFHGENNGYVVSTRDSTVRVWKFVPGASGVEGNRGFAGQSLHIHPNPVSEKLKYFARLSGRCSLRILNVLGQVVNERDIELQPMEYVSLDLPGYFPNGCYYLELRRGTAREGQRFMIQR